MCENTKKITGGFAPIGIILFITGMGFIIYSLIIGGNTVMALVGCAFAMLAGAGMERD